MEFSITATDINQNIPLSQIKIGEEVSQKTIFSEVIVQNTQIDLGLSDSAIKDPYSLNKETKRTKKVEIDEE
jgi:hypothetical protein